MDWLVAPLPGFTEVDSAIANVCSGGGELRHCQCTAGLVECGPTPNSFVIQTQS